MALRQTRRSAGVLPRLAAGLLKKIQFQLLLTNLALEFSDALPGQAQIAGCHDRRLREHHTLSGPAACSQCARPSSAKVISPEIEQVAAELKLTSQCAHTLSGHHSPDRRELHLPARDTGLLRHQFSSRELSLLSVSHFWRSIHFVSVNSCCIAQGARVSQFLAVRHPQATHADHRDAAARGPGPRSQRHSDETWCCLA
jgi:hypothetical protein